MTVREPVEHINLLQRTGPAFIVGPAFLALMAVSLTTSVWLGTEAWRDATAAREQRAAMTRQVSDLQAAITALATERERNAEALALRAEIDRLQPRAAAGRLLTTALAGGDAARRSDVTAALGAMGSAAEPGVWLTALSVSGAPTRVEVKGEARDSAAVLRFARRANDALRPLAMQVDQVNIEPAGVAGPGSVVTPGGLVSFVLK